MKNGHVRLGEDAHYYSVPCRYIGKKVILLCLPPGMHLLRLRADCYPYP
ncbi:hypothetical protein [Bacteroides fragilis]